MEQLIGDTGAFIHVCRVAGRKVFLQVDRSRRYGQVPLGLLLCVAVYGLLR